MIDAQVLSHDFDEEAVGFGKPETPAAEPAAELSLAHKGALALVGIGLLSLVVQVFSGPLEKFYMLI